MQQLLEPITLQLDTAGPKGRILCGSFHGVYFRCKIIGYQDTIYAKQSLQLFIECEIFHTIYFIFCDAQVIFQ